MYKSKEIVVLYEELLNQEGFKMKSISEKSLIHEPYTLIADRWYIGGKDVNEIIVQGSIVKSKSGEVAYFLVKDANTAELFIKVVALKRDSSLNLLHVLKIFCDKDGIQHSFMQRTEAVHAGSLSAYCRPRFFKDVMDFINSSSLVVGMA